MQSAATTPAASDALTDRFQRRVTYLRLSITDRCNYRCAYCMPAAGLTFLPAKELLTYEEIVVIVSALARVGIRRVRVTGGEPLVRREVPLLIEKLSAIEGIDEVVMTTNAHLLERFAGDLAAAGLEGLNISIDTLDPKRFAKITRGGSLERVLRGLDAAKRAGIPRIKLNTVAIKHFNDGEICDLVRFSIQQDVVLRFIELMPIGSDTIWEGGACLPAKQIRESLSEHYRLEPEGFQAGKGPARYWRLFGGDAPAHGYPVGIIAAVTECFCDACNRIRLTALGGLRACLADDREVNLRDVLRSGGGEADVVEAVQSALFAKKESHAFRLDGGGVTNKQMVSIGG